MFHLCQPTTSFVYRNYEPTVSVWLQLCFSLTSFKHLFFC